MLVVLRRAPFSIGWESMNRIDLSKISYQDHNVLSDELELRPE